ncbi:MAG: glycerol-3-phosphate 1-O-acyltransferase PlsY [Oceanococcus sp.]
MSSALALTLSFVLGSLLGGQLIGRLKGLDLRQSGSGNLGATNALRSAGISSAVIVLAFDAGKAALAVWLSQLLAPQQSHWLPWACGVMAVLGHVYSPLAGFKGGKGVACGLGASLYLIPWAALLGLAGFILSLTLSGYVSLSVLFACSLIVLKVACFSALGLWSAAGAFAVFMLLLLSWAHRENWQRLLKGEESRFEKIMLFKPRR